MALERADGQLRGGMGHPPADATALFSADRLQSGFHFVGVAGGRLHGLVRTGGAGFERSSYGRRFHSKNTQVRFQESICSGESTRSSVFSFTRRLKVCPPLDGPGAGSTYTFVSARSGFLDRSASTIC